MNDLISPLHAPPPRYLLESDSSDEEGQGNYPSSSRPKITVNHPRVDISLTSPTSPRVRCSEAIIGVGQAGRYMLRKAGKGKEVATISLGGDVLGRAYEYEGGVILLALDEPEAAFTWEVAGQVTRAIEAESWLIVTTYVPAMYIPSPAEASSRHARSSDAIRILQVTKVGGASQAPDGVERWQSPNYLSGLAAAFASMAAHPAHSLSSPLNTLLLPLPLSALAPSTLLPALTPLAPHSSAIISRRITAQLKETGWAETDDEPYSAPGMGGARWGRNKGRRAGEGMTSGDVSGIYT